MPKQLLMLIGPKGAGKTYIGTLLGRRTDILFISVEPIWLALASGEDGWEAVERAIDAAFRTRDRVMIESLGAGDGFRRFHAALAQKYPITMIRVAAGLDTCMQRVRTRDSAAQIAVPDEKVAEYNAIAAQVRYDWALEIDNDPPAPDEAIVAAIRAL
ncbi:MAG TPA: hypothetical protein VFS21_10930 [Roseiflexaceae bacterium]|nr:hypothetical protein [Roseiflexaceae bacterium]